MRHLLFTVATGVSLLLCAATGILWEQSYDEGYRVQVDLAGSAQSDGSRTVTAWEIHSNYGRVEFAFGFDHWHNDQIAGLPSSYLESSFYHAHTNVSLRPLKGSFIGLILWDGWKDTDHSYSAIFLPHWVLAVIFAVPPVSYLLANRRGPHRIDGRCHACFYDLTGNVSRVCPECGSPVPPNPPGLSFVPTEPPSVTPRDAHWICGTWWRRLRWPS